MTEIAGYAAEYASTDGMFCMGFGETQAIAQMRANFQISGASAGMKALMRTRITYRPVGADEASEIMEMLDTPY
ncbi:MAG TPA: hypothetical protein VNU68_35410 [Verrucomicrobiae bacterium]|nr:hypothetical protein [Verrucomicrobiae bacterium]